MLNMMPRTCKEPSPVVEMVMRLGGVQDYATLIPRESHAVRALGGACPGYETLMLASVGTRHLFLLRSMARKIQEDVLGNTCTYVHGLLDSLSRRRLDAQLTGDIAATLIIDRRIRSTALAGGPDAGTQEGERRTARSS
jgi:hypothetical protein